MEEKSAPEIRRTWGRGVCLACCEGRLHSLDEHAAEVSANAQQAVENTLDAQLEDVQVCAPGMWENEHGPLDWFAVCTGEGGIVAYFQDEAAALFFRLALVNARLNSIK